MVYATPQQAQQQQQQRLQEQAQQQQQQQQAHVSGHPQTPSTPMLSPDPIFQKPPPSSVSSIRGQPIRNVNLVTAAPSPQHQVSNTTSVYVQQQQQQQQQQPRPLPMQSQALKLQRMLGTSNGSNGPSLSLGSSSRALPPPSKDTLPIMMMQQPQVSSPPPPLPPQLNNNYSATNTEVSFHPPSRQPNYYKDYERKANFDGMYDYEGMLMDHLNDTPEQEEEDPQETNYGHHHHHQQGTSTTNPTSAPPHAHITPATKSSRSVKKPPSTNGAFYAQQQRQREIRMNQTNNKNNANTYIISPEQQQQEQHCSHRPPSRTNNSIDSSYTTMAVNSNNTVNHATNTSYSTQNTSMVAMAAPALPTTTTSSSSSSAARSSYSNTSKSPSIVVVPPLMSTNSSSTMAAVMTSNAEGEEDDDASIDSFPLNNNSELLEQPPFYVQEQGPYCHHQQQQQQQPFVANESPVQKNVHSPMNPQQTQQQSAAGLPAHNDKIKNKNKVIKNNNRHPPATSLRDSKDVSWRRHGRTYREQLIRHDEQGGHQNFEMSQDCSIQRYHMVAEKVLNQFLATREDPNVNLRDTYLVGTRLSKFLWDVLPSHKDYHSSVPELAQMRRESHARWLTLNHYLEELALIIDEEEHNQFVLRDLDDTLNEEEFDDDDDDNVVDNNNDDNNNNTGQAYSQHPSAMGQGLHSFRNMNAFHDNDPNAQNMQAEGTTNVPPPLVNVSPKKHRNMSRSPTCDGNNAYPPSHSLHYDNRDGGIPSNVRPIAPSNVRPIGGEGEDIWHIGDGVKTENSVDSNWFSMAGFSDPFPPSLEINNTSQTQPLTPHLEVLEEAAPTAEPKYLSSVHHQFRNIPNHEQVNFTSLSLDEDGGTALDYMAFAGPAKKEPATVSPSPAKSTPDTSKNDPSSWTSDPFASALTNSTQSKPSDLCSDSEDYKQTWGSSPFGNKMTNISTTSNNRPRVSWLDPANDGKQQDTSSPVRQQQQEQPGNEVAWWVESPDRPSRGCLSGLTGSDSQYEMLPGLTGNDSQYETSSALRRSSSSRYMSLDEHEKHNRSKQRHESTGTSNRSLLSNTICRRDNDDDDDSGIAEMSAALDRNRAQGANTPYRHRGMHHFKECVRCLLE